MPAISYLNGTWQAPEDAKVSILDRGYLFGDGVYEVIPVYHRKAFEFSRHLARLNESLREIHLANPMSEAEWKALVDEAIARSTETTAYLYLHVTRGVVQIRDFRYPDNPQPSVLLMLHGAPVREQRAIVPLKTITLDDFRWARGHIKAISLIAAGMLKNEAFERDADEAILIRDGRVTEATAANVFIIKNGILATPPKSNHLLHGVTREVLLDLAREHGIPIEERDIAAEELKRADEIFISSTTFETWPVGMLNGKPVGNGEAGPLWKRIDAFFQQYKLQSA